MKDRDVTVSDNKKAVTYLNGKYYYDYYLREMYCSEFFAETYHVSEENVIMVHDKVIDSGDGENIKYYEELMDMAGNEELPVRERYEYLMDSIDVQSYIDFVIANVYLNNLDVAEGINTILWRTETVENEEYGNAKWRWAIYDLDYCDIERETPNYAEENTFATFLPHYQQQINKWRIYSVLRSEPEFDKQFVLSFMDMANINFAPENVGPLLEEYGEDLSWHNSFFLKRKGYMLEYLRQEFYLQGTLETVTIDMTETAGGTVYINTSCLHKKEGVWTGEYFTDYPVTVKAVPEEGYEFVGWTGELERNSEEIEIELKEGGIYLKPVFRKQTIS